MMGFNYESRLHRHAAISPPTASSNKQHRPLQLNGGQFGINPASLGYIARKSIVSSDNRKRITTALKTFHQKESKKSGVKRLGGGMTAKHFDDSSNKNKKQADCKIL